MNAATLALNPAGLARMRGLDQPHRPPIEAGLSLPPDDGLDALV